MRHRIPARRYDPDYFLKLVRGNSHGALLVRIYHGNCTRHRTFLAWPVCKYFCVQVLYRGMRRRIESAMARGEYDALQEIRRRRARAPQRLPAPPAVGLGVPTTDQPNP